MHQSSGSHSNMHRLFAASAFKCHDQCSRRNHPTMESTCQKQAMHPYPRVTKNKREPSSIFYCRESSRGKIRVSISIVLHVAQRSDPLIDRSVRQCSRFLAKSRRCARPTEATDDRQRAMLKPRTVVQALEHVSLPRSSSSAGYARVRGRCPNSILACSTRRVR